MTTRWKSMVVAGLCVSLGVLGVTACQSGTKDNKTDTKTADAGGSGGMIPQLIFPAEVGNTVGGLANYNPYAPNPVVWTWLYEPLIVRNSLTCEETPWLATKSTWEGAEKLTLEIRDGVKWSDGKPFTANDVAFTFNLMKKYEAFDLNGVWTDLHGAPATSVVAEGNKVIFTFSGNAAAKYDGIITTKTLPEHVYSTVGDPTKYIDKKPVATGPFKLASYNGRRVVLERRADYWQADKIKVEKLILEGNYDASQAALKLRAGQLDAYNGEIPNPEKTFVASDPKLNHYYYAAAGMTVAAPNLDKKPFNDPKFREAISYAMDKEGISVKALYGIMKPASQTGLRLPAMNSMVPEKYKDTSVIPYDIAKANELLEAAGYKKGPDGKRTMPDGSPLAIKFSVQQGWIDYQAMADVIVKGLNDAGVESKVVGNSPDVVDVQKKTGDFEMLLDYLHGGCAYANDIGARLSSKNIPTDKEVRANVERFRDPAIDKVVDDLGATTDKAKEKEYVGQLVDVMMTQRPVIALTYAAARIIYRTDHAVGWPSEEDPYANPQDDKLLIMTHLTAPPK